MGEAIPVIAGIAIGLLVALLPRLTRRRRWLLGTVLTLVAGISATLINGETISFLPFDVVLVALCATAAAALPGLLTRARGAKIKRAVNRRARRAGPSES